MQLITEGYRTQNARKHEASLAYGSHGAKYVTQVQDLARGIPAHTILDYGCGKRELERALGYAIANYDPAIPGCEAAPAPADLVVCTDVLEHVEPECLDAVLDDLKRVTLHTILLTVSMIPANKHMPDGSNAHRIIENAKWWMPKLQERFDLANYVGDRGSFLAIMRAQAKPQ